MKTFSAGEFL